MVVGFAYDYVYYLSSHGLISLPPRMEGVSVTGALFTSLKKTHAFVSETSRTFYLKVLTTDLNSEDSYNMLLVYLISRI